MKEEFNKDPEILKKYKTEILEMKSIISQIKNTVESLSSRVDQIQDRISGLKDKVDALEESYKKRGKNEVQMELTRPPGHYEKTNPMNHGYRRR
jgi:predicted RNase H-like nuclease (RuvC/YqgF family)